MNDKEKLTFTDVSKYLKAIPNDDTDKLVLVGGQALNLWAEIAILLINIDIQIKWSMFFNN